MTEQDIAESITTHDCQSGIETAEELLFMEYDDAYREWNDDPTEGAVDVERITELEKSLLALRIAKQIIGQNAITDEVVRDIATNTPMNDSSSETLENTAEEVISVLSEK